MGGIDAEAEASSAVAKRKLSQKRKSAEEAFRQEEREVERLRKIEEEKENAAAWMKGGEGGLEDEGGEEEGEHDGSVKGDEIEDEGEEDDEENDATYGTPKKRRRLEIVSFDMPVKEYLDAFSRAGDRRNMSFAARCDTATIGLEKAGLDLTDIPCSRASMWRYHICL